MGFCYDGKDHENAFLHLTTVLCADSAGLEVRGAKVGKSPSSPGSKVGTPRGSSRTLRAERQRRRRERRRPPQPATQAEPKVRSLAVSCSTIPRKASVASSLSFTFSSVPLVRCRKCLAKCLSLGQILHLSESVVTQ